MDEETPLTGSFKTVRHVDLPKYPTQPTRKHDKYFLGVTYMLAMGVCGIVLVALGSTLGDLALNSKSSATAVGSVFIARGAGAVLGAILSAKLYVWFQGSHVMTYSLILIAIILAILPFNKSIILLHGYFLLLGIGTSITDTGTGAYIVFILFYFPC